MSTSTSQPQQRRRSGAGLPVADSGNAPHEAALLVPALRCHMGRWTYYAAGLRLSDVAERIRLAEDIHQSRSLNELIQRALSKRTKDIKDYLVRQRRDRFFNAIVVGVYGGEPEWFDVRVQGNSILSPDQIPEHVSESLGILRLSGSEVLFAIDGQHRVEGIREAVAEDRSLLDEQITALFVAHEKTKAGLARTRRLFTTLNRYAKPISKRDAIALDEDDVVAIVTRDLVDSHPLFADKISITHVKSIPISQRTQFTTIVALYDALDVFLRARAKARPGEWKQFKRYRRPDVEIQENRSAASALFDAVIVRFPEVGEMARAPSDAPVAGKYRDRDGGHLLFRPIGLLILADAIAVFQAAGASMEEALDSIARVPMRLDSPPWLGLLWDSVNRRMITRSENRRAATRVLFFGAGGDLRRMNTTKSDLTTELRGLLAKEQIELRRYR